MGSMLNIPSRMEGPEQKTIIGKPEITVSAKGIQNGTSVYLNDGADFGQDTKLGATTPGQYGPPYTKTSGLAEAGAFCEANNIREIIFYYNNNVNLSATINITSDIKITGKSSGSGLGAIVFSYASPQFYVTGRLRIEGLNVIGNGSSQIFIQSATTSTQITHIMKDFYYENIGTVIYADNEPSGYWYCENVHDNANYTGALKNMIFLNSINSNGATIINPSFNYSSVNIQEGSVIQLGGSVDSIVVSQASYTCIGGRINALSHTTPITTIVGSSLDCNVIVLGGRIATHNTATTDFINSSGSGGSTHVFFSHSSIGIQASMSTAVNLFTNSITSGLLLIFVESGTIDMGSGYTGTFNFNPTHISGEVIATTANTGTLDTNPQTPTTPAVPASGTAQANSNPYPVTVYIYGGTVTVINYTPVGGAATQIGTAGPAAVRLNPGDSITLTYSAAPSWNWASA